MSMSVRPEPDLLTTGEAASYLRCHTRTIRRLVKAGLRAAHTAWGPERATLYRRADLDRFRRGGDTASVEDTATACPVPSWESLRSALVAVTFAGDLLQHTIDALPRACAARHSGQARTPAADPAG